MMINAEPVLKGERFCALEKIPTTVCTNPKVAALRVAKIIADTIVNNNIQNEKTVLGLATGHTPVGVYHELIRMHQDEGLDFSHVVTFNLDEYYGLQPDSLQSYHRWMRENFFNHVNIPKENIHIPEGTLSPDKTDRYCEEYEKKIAQVGGIDIQILGIGRTGHIGFNEPGSARNSKMRLLSLDPITRRDAAANFFGEDNVPRQAITMGVGTILKARRILLMAFGEQKAAIIKKAVEGPVTDAVAASYLQEHPQTEVVLDRSAAAELTRMATPWLLGEVPWNETLAYKAVIWLSLTTGKSILKLGQDDYDSHHMASLARQYGSADELNRKVFHQLSRTITPRENLPTGKRMLCFSPHPDDDVISVGATLVRLVQADNEIHTAYMTSGNIAVADDHAIQMLEFWADLSFELESNSQKVNPLVKKVQQFLDNKAPGQVDSPELQQIKTLIRKSEALAACRWLGIPQTQAHFLDLPFYQTGEVRKRPISDEDVGIVLELLQKVKPHWVFVAGELSDPHGTHRLCAEVIFAALEQLEEHQQPEAVWLYRGAWQEWDPNVIDMAIPLTRSELRHKIFGIFKHQSQKDKALFPGPYDDREFWQRAEARNTDTAALFNKLGLPEYYAMEAFVRHEP